MKKKLRLLLAVPVLFLVAVLTIAGLHARGEPGTNDPGGSSASQPTPGEVGADTATGQVEPGATNDLVGGRAGTADKQAVSTQPMSRAVISTGQVTLRPDSVTRARSEVLRLVASWGGSVADEESTSDRRGRIVDSTLTLRVPTARFADAMRAFGGLGKLEQQSSKTEDVSTQVIDNDARVRAAERSIRQIEVLLDRAERLSDIIAIESDLARRQADLDSLRSQQAYLADQTSLSTINVYLTRTAHVTRTDEAHGFLAGLDDGWTAMKGATVVLLTVLGAVLPFAVLLLLLGVPLWLVVRRRHGAGPVSSGSAPARSA